jgi:hypothetical protein
LLIKQLTRGEAVDLLGTQPAVGVWRANGHAAYELVAIATETVSLSNITEWQRHQPAQLTNAG